LQKSGKTEKNVEILKIFWCFVQMQDYKSDIQGVPKNFGNENLHRSKFDRVACAFAFECDSA
jgi:hypothetical protein